MVYANPKYLYLLLLLIPLIVWYIIKLRKMQATFKMSSGFAFEKAPSTIRVYLRHFPFLLRVVAIALVIIVLARPQSVNSSDVSNSEGIDIVMALDISGTMMAQDFSPTRLEAAKKVAAEFINDRPNDRIGLVIFGGESFTQCPLTTDHKVLLNLLTEVKFGMIEDGTAIGLGLANSVNRLKDSKSKSRVVILLTDGSNNAGQIAPLTAAELAASYDIRVYTIGIGSRGTSTARIMTPYGLQTMQVSGDFDERTLTEIAAITKGQYFRATDNTSLSAIYDEIDQMEKTHISVNTVTKRKELYMPFAIFALALVGLELVLRRTWLRNIP
ncbi:VWA domain-containing protein [Dysgonomonas sp. GY75]|uniref:vWA domain-containing protein n=1 Tax=Dysgonomonas sp. GY75 TaxID=2780419 RepID=UPI001883F5F7|nr:VWA domain-containing protein [Dysgonomonas sp. GY75]MBF0649835.1 VWA domain-containing protein [Dysgonomonas sp. GY75]